MLFRSAAAVNIDIRGNAANNTSVLFDCTNAASSSGLKISNVSGIRIYDLAVTNCTGYGIGVQNRSNVNIYRVYSKLNKYGFNVTEQSRLSCNTCEADQSTSYSMSASELSFLYIVSINMHDSANDGIRVGSSSYIHCLGGSSPNIVTKSGGYGDRKSVV